MCVRVAAGGYVVPPMDYLKDVRKICDENNFLMIADEVCVCARALVAVLAPLT